MEETISVADRESDGVWQWKIQPSSPWGMDVWSLKNSSSGNPGVSETYGYPILANQTIWLDTKSEYTIIGMSEADNLARLMRGYCQDINADGGEWWEEKPPNYKGSNYVLTGLRRGRICAVLCQRTVNSPNKYMQTYPFGGLELP
ncbi:hypothetical protein TWF694_001919 [Orbilia ellipsospora]|uniref:Uncharacterized protein n=1 Tax=Orbilia ellipsospora TaxID=2528407 RepID=A0AAV9X5C5_9PEZI